MHWGIERNPPVPHFQTNHFWVQQWKRCVESRRIGIIRTSALMKRTDAFSTWATCNYSRAEETIEMAPVRKVIREPQGMLRWFLRWTSKVGSASPKWWTAHGWNRWNPHWFFLSRWTFETFLYWNPIASPCRIPIKSTWEGEHER